MNIALLGCGVVGGGVLEIAEKRADMSVKYVLVRRDKPELGEKAVKDINVILNDDEVDTVVEVMGGLSPAYEYVRAALRAGKNVVTANKHLVAHYYKELVELAEEHGAAFRCTPAVGGGIPWLVNLERVKRLDSVRSFCGIIRKCFSSRSFSLNSNIAAITELSSPYRHIRSSKHCNNK